MSARGLGADRILSPIDKRDCVRDLAEQRGTRKTTTDEREEARKAKSSWKG